MGEEKKHTRNSKVFANDGHNKKKKTTQAPVGQMAKNLSLIA